MRRARTLPVLADNGLVRRGTVIEIVADALPDDITTRDPRVFRARIENPAGLRDSVIWEFDSAPYSLTALTYKLQEEYGVACLEHYIFKHWRIAGHLHSMWEEAERFPR